MIANNTVVSKLLCHDLDEPPDMIHYAPRSGPVGPGQLFRQVPKAENCVQVSPSDCICREFSQGGLWASPFFSHCQLSSCANPCLVGLIVPSPKHHQTLLFSQKKAINHLSFALVLTLNFLDKHHKIQVEFCTCCEFWKLRH